MCPNERPVERRQVPGGGGGDLVVQKRMTPDRALAVDDHRARQNVGPLDGDPDRHRLIHLRQDVPRAAADGGAGANIHGIVDDAAHRVRQVGLDDRRRDNRVFPRVHRAGGQPSRGVHDVGEAADARQRFLDAFEAADRRVELFPDRRVRTDQACRHLCRGARERRQGDRAPRSQALHEHPPSLAGHGGAADDRIDRDEDVASPVRAVLKRDAHRIVPGADLDAGKVSRHERAGYPPVLAAAEQAVRVAQTKRKADDRRHRPERDVALAPVEPDPKHLLTTVRAAAHDAYALRRRRVAARFWAGQRKAGHLVAAGQAPQVVLFLFVGSVPKEQLRGSERVRHHDGHGGRDAAAAHLHDDRRVRGGRESRGRRKASGMIIPKNPWRFRKLHTSGREVARPHDVPLPEHRAELVDGTVEKRLLPVGERLRRERQELPPIRAAREEIALPPHRAGVKRFPLGLADPRQHRSHQPHRDAAHELPTKCRNPRRRGQEDEQAQNSISRVP